MLIGEDYPKIEWNIFDIHFLEPNAFIGDMIIAAVSFYFFRKITKQHILTPFNNNWRYFYLTFCASFIAGGLGHFLYNYWGVEGKLTAGFIAMLPPYFAEQAMVSIYPNHSKREFFRTASKIKLRLFVLAHIFAILFIDMRGDDPSSTRSTIIPAMANVIGLAISLGLLGGIYAKKIHSSFKYLWISALILIPSAIFLIFKISFAQWFDRNDAGHFLIIISLFMYYQTIYKYEAFLIKNKKSSQQSNIFMDSTLDKPHST